MDKFGHRRDNELAEGQEQDVDGKWAHIIGC